MVLNRASFSIHAFSAKPLIHEPSVSHSVNPTHTLAYSFI